MIQDQLDHRGVFHASDDPDRPLALLTGEGHQLLVVALLAAHPEEAVIQTAALEVVGKLPLHVAGQGFAFGFQVETFSGS